MRKISLVFFGLVALARAFPNPQDEDEDLLAGIAAGAENTQRYANSDDGIDPNLLACLFTGSCESNKNPLAPYEIINEIPDDKAASEENCHPKDAPIEDHSPDIKIDETSNNCTDYADQGFRCVPYYSCEDGEIVIDGAGLFNPRLGSDPLLDAENSKCPGHLEMCCRHPDWFGIPITTPIKIVKPPPKDLVICPDPVPCPEDCNNQGTCDTTTGTCTCNSGFQGVSCSELRCPNDCSSQGGCNTATGICVCNVGFLGDACQFLDDKVLLECNTAGDCPSIRTQCHAMANPTPSGKTGYCVPSTCENQSDCPEIGDICVDGKISGTCPIQQQQFPISCQYEPFRAIGKCGPGPDGYEERDNTVLLGCSTADDCPQWESGSNCVIANGNGYCVPLFCENNACPGIGNECQDGELYGTCNADSQCEYPPFLAIATCEIPCPDNCNNYGTCDTTTGTCACYDGWKGVACNVADVREIPCPDNCNNYGACDLTTGTCTCFDGWKGVACNVADEPQIPCPEDCNYQGACDSTTGTCICNAGFKGNSCSVLDIVLPNNVLLECNSANDCPTSRGQCNTMLTANPSGSSGQCVPLNCQTDTDCPTIGDECQDGALFGQCNSAYTCDYSKVLGFGNCQGSADPDINPNDKYRGQCGKRHPAGIGVRIQSNDPNDRVTQFGEWPHMCAVLNRTKIGEEEHSLFVCGGSLIAPNVVLTAAHCIDSVGSDVSTLMVRCGEWDTQGDHEPVNHQDRFAQQVMIHPGYIKKNLNNDVAIIVMKEEFILDQHIGTICLPDQNDYSNINWKGCVATGWGKDNWGQAGQYQVIMKQITMDMVDHETCEAKLRTTRLGEFFKLHKSFNCAGGIGGEDACTGDGGGPLVCPTISSSTKEDVEYDYDDTIVVGGRTANGSNSLDVRSPSLDSDVTYIQTGIIAWGVECGINGVPGVYANVSDALCFIDYATKCALGQDADLYGLTGCRRWAKRSYCELQQEYELEQFDTKIEQTTQLRAKSKLFRKRAAFQKLLTSYEDMVFGCYTPDDSIARQNFTPDCNNFDYYPEEEDTFDAGSLARTKGDAEES